jgi:hypothetical protein
VVNKNIVISLFKLHQFSISLRKKDEIKFNDNVGGKLKQSEKKQHEVQLNEYFIDKLMLKLQNGFVNYKRKIFIARILK